MEQLMKERDLERAEVARASQQCEKVETELAKVAADADRLRAELRSLQEAFEEEKKYASISRKSGEYEGR